MSDISYDPTIGSTSRSKQRDLYHRLKLIDEPLFAILSREEVLSFVNLTWHSANRTSKLTPPDAVYPCVTQPMGTIHDLMTSSNEGVVLLWKRGSCLNWCARADGYPFAKHAVVAAASLWRAANRWMEALGGRVRFKYVSDIREAHFILEFGGNRGSVMAEAFTPRDASNTLNFVRVFKAAFHQALGRFLDSVFLHELGHVLGLKHEVEQSTPMHWLPGKLDRNGKCTVVWGAVNGKSVMGFRFGVGNLLRDADNLKLALDEFSDGEIVVGAGKFKVVNKIVKFITPGD